MCYLLSVSRLRCFKRKLKVCDDNKLMKECTVNGCGFIEDKDLLAATNLCIVFLYHLLHQARHPKFRGRTANPAAH